MRGQVADLSGPAFNADDELKLAFFAEATSKLLVLMARMGSASLGLRASRRCHLQMQGRM